MGVAALQDDKKMDGCAQPNEKPTVRRQAFVCAVLAVLAGCSHLPEAQVGYYLAETKVTVKVVRTVACDKAGTLIVANAATPSVQHAADRKRRIEVDLSRFAGQFTDADLKFEFHEDGRLKGLNASSTGQGEAALSSAIKVASVAIAAAAPLVSPPGAKALPPECTLISAATEGKPLTLTYEGEVAPGNIPSPFRELAADAASEPYVRALAHLIGGVCATFTDVAAMPAPVQYKGRADTVRLTARQPAVATLKVHAGPTLCRDAEIWSGPVPIAQFGLQYDIALPVAGVFGKQGAMVSFADSGALLSMQYTTTPGGTQALNVVNAGLTEWQGRTAARAAQVKAEADLIAQQQRLVACRADPATCKPE